MRSVIKKCHRNHPRIKCPSAHNLKDSYMHFVSKIFKILMIALKIIFKL